MKKVKCIKDLTAKDIVFCKKGDVVDVIIEDDCYYENEEYPMRFMDEDPFGDIAIRSRSRKVSIKKYTIIIDWLRIVLYSSKTAVIRKGGLLFGDYFMEEDMALTADNVEKVFSECSTSVRNNFIAIEGINNNYIFDKDKIDEYKSEIKNMIYQLPKSFMKDNGGGESFLNMCMREDGYQWTGLHVTMEKLMCLGIAAELCKYVVPREMWKVLPCGMPYIVVV